MTSITALPHDLLVSIIDHLSTKQQLALSCVSRSLNAAAVPCLYRDVQCVATKSHACARRLALLLRTLLEQPKRRAHVRVIRLGGSHHYWTEYDPWPEDERGTHSDGVWGLRRCGMLSKGQVAFVSKQIHSHIDDALRLSQGHSSIRSKDALATTILTLCTSIDTLDIGDGFMRYSRLLPSIVMRMDRLFPQLAHITLGDKQPSREKTFPYVDLDLLRPIFYSSTITCFNCTVAEPWKFSWNSSQPPRNTNLTTLRLMRTNITRSTLAHLLSATPNLRILQYEQEIVFDQSSIESPSLAPYLDLNDLNTALSYVQHTLEECQFIIRLAPGYISAADYPTSGIPFPSIDGTLNLQDMPRLRRVEVPLIMFFGWFPKFSSRLEDVLPHGISELTLRDDLVPYCSWSSRLSSRERRIARVGKYIRDREALAPCLQTVKVRLTGAKVLLRDAVQGIRNATSGGDVKTSVVRGTKSETYSWRFETVGGEGVRPRLGTRVDSIIRSASDEDSSSGMPMVVRCGS